MSLGSLPCSLQGGRQILRWEGKSAMPLGKPQRNGGGGSGNSRKDPEPRSTLKSDNRRLLDAASFPLPQPILIDPRDQQGFAQ